MTRQKQKSLTLKFDLEKAGVNGSFLIRLLIENVLELDGEGRSGDVYLLLCSQLLLMKSLQIGLEVREK